MKHCINPACDAELEDYMERCPECGRSQKKIVVPKSSEMTSNGKPEQQIVRRHGFVTFWLYLVAVVNFFAAIAQMLPKQMYGSYFPDEYVGISIISGVLCIVNIIGVALVLNWKKAGFWVIVGASLISSLMTSLVMRTFPTGIISLIILWAILQIKKDGISCWRALR